jgi:hypothetical protein
MSQRDLFTILDECVSRLRQGDPPEACLADYPTHAGELAPDLALTAELFHLSLLEPSADAVALGHQKMMAALDVREKRSRLADLSAFMDRYISPLRRRQHGAATTLLRTAVIAIVLLVVSGSFAITASADSLPGDILYPVKLSWENTRLALTIDESSRQSLQIEFERRRRAEVQAVMDLRKPVIVEFKGVLESSTAEVWMVDGLDVYITDDTKMDGAINVGQKIIVRARVRDDGSLNALKIITDDIQPRQTATFTPTPPPTQTPQPTRKLVAPTPTTPHDEPRPEPMPTEKPTDRPTRPSTTPLPSDELTPTHKPTDRPKDEPTSTQAPSLDREPTRETHPTNTPSRDSLATSLPHLTETPANHDPAPSSPPTDEPPPSPTATSQPNRESTPTHEPTATHESDTGDRNDRPP